MTTAHRPTWHAAVGQKNEGGWQTGGQTSQQFSARDLPGHTKLKIREIGQGTANEVDQLDLREELYRKEFKAKEEKENLSVNARDKMKRLEENKRLLLMGDPAADAQQEELLRITSKYDDADAGEDSEESSESDRDSDEDEEAELMRELEKIKKEREAERLAMEQKLEARDAVKSREEVLRGNPLTQQATRADAKMKRRWNDDVVFKNQSRNEPELKKRFINDTIRNDFHRRFLSKYIQ